MCASSDDSSEPAHERTLCRNDRIKWVYKWRYLLIVMLNEISTFIAHMLSHYAQLSSNMHECLLVACSCMHAYLVGLEALDLISV